MARTAAVRVVSDNPSPIKSGKAVEPDWDKAEIERLAKIPHSVVNVLVTPRLAKILLEFNKANRPERAARILEFVDILRNDRWINTGEPIIVSDVGLLNEGQHRLQGVVNSGIPAVMDIRFGIAREAFVVTGTGASRTAGDMLALQGFSDHNALAATAKMLIAYDQGLPGSYRWRVAPDLILGAIQRWPDMSESLKKYKSKLHATYFTNSAASAFAFLAYRQTKNDEEVGTFLEIVQTGICRSVSDPARLLRERLMNDAELRWGGREVMVQKLALFITAWNLWRAGARPTRVNWRKTDPFPVMEKVKL